MLYSFLLRRCLLSIDDRIMDITSFLPFHPGSPETLLNAAGSEVTRYFHDIGHSLDAIGKFNQFTLVNLPRLPVNNCNNARLLSSSQKYLKAQKLALQSVDSTSFYLYMKSKESDDAEFASSPMADVSGHFTSEACREGLHFGSTKAIFDPVSVEWSVWWSCCGNGFLCEKTKSIIF